MDLRDKYIKASLQRLGDNPRDYDDHFKGFAEQSYGDVAGARADAPINQLESQGDAPCAKWRIYPRPPPPHWHFSDRKRRDISPEEQEENFEFDQVDIPGPDPKGWQFGVDKHGVTQIYDSTSRTSSLQECRDS